MVKAWRHREEAKAGQVNSDILDVDGLDDDEIAERQKLNDSAVVASLNALATQLSTKK